MINVAAADKYLKFDRVFSVSYLNIKTRRATRTDVDFLLHLRKITMTKYLEQTGSILSNKAHLRRVNHHFSDTQIIELDGKPVGMIKAGFSPQLSQWRLIQIQIHPNYQNLSIGSRMINLLIRKARAQNASLVLSVLRVNPAIKLYKRLGFITNSETEFEFEMELKTRA